ncbi:type VII secretion protein EccB [Crossiella sp. SN42]|uniref:type VII secretion protein EccB n=1 Tax=Crossiella sp. SN42 TaxID=2944808 RepID=UPI00207C7701|nr:type VII secretion protein EccB [Crossiella sp. SN42]MCO1582060.1 type VII secretion protein EccB [Crossiella sp. SN42]
MASSRDQLQAHQFLAQRAISALVTRETDPEQPPFRRPSVSAFGSIALAVIILAGFGVYGLIVPGGKDAWRTGDAVIVEKETGARLVYVDGRLRPVTNHTSALLALGKHAPTMDVSQASLAGVPRAPRIGLLDVPDGLPARERVLGGGWSMCSQPAVDTTGAAVHESVLLVGQAPGGGRALGESALLLEPPEQGDWQLVWRGHRHRIAQADTAAVRLALRTGPVLRAGSALVDNLPAGAEIGPITLRDIGKPSTAVPGKPDLRIGQLALVRTSGEVTQRYLVEADRLRPISELQYEIQRAHKPTAEALGEGELNGVALSPLAVSGAKLAAVEPARAGQAPERRPEFVGPAAGAPTVCASFEPGAEVPTVTVDSALPQRDPALRTGRRTDAGLPLADRVVVSPGSVALVEVMPSPRAPVGTLSLVSDQGRNHPLATPDVLAMLGYEGVRPVRMPAGLVARIPLGSGLDPLAAQRP